MFCVCNLNRKIYPHLANRLSEFRQHLVDTSSEMSELKVWEMQGE